MDGDYGDKTLMPSDTFPCLNPILLHLNLRCPLHRRLLSARPLFVWTPEDAVTHHPAAMKTALALLLFVSLACHSQALKCHTCVASNEDDCNRQGSTSCPQYADACSTITGPNTVMKSCTYKAFCDKANGAGSAAKMVCCFGDDCNGPHRSHSHGHHSGAGALASSPLLLITALLLRLAFSQL